MSKLKSLSQLIFFSLLAIAVWLSIIIGSTIAQVPRSNLQLAQELYLETCSSCHLPIPAEVLPTNTWEKILKNPTNHYGESLPKSSAVNIRLMWSYLKFNSRLLLPGEPIPRYVTNSRYFKALHPQIDLPQPATHQTCLVCHPQARELNYRNLGNGDW